MGQCTPQDFEFSKHEEPCRLQGIHLWVMFPQTGGRNNPPQMMAPIPVPTLKRVQAFVCYVENQTLRLRTCAHIAMHTSLYLSRLCLDTMHLRRNMRQTWATLAHNALCNMSDLKTWMSSTFMNLHRKSFAHTRAETHTYTHPLDRPLAWSLSHPLTHWPTHSLAHFLSFTDTHTHTHLRQRQPCFHRLCTCCMASWKYLRMHLYVCNMSQRIQPRQQQFYIHSHVLLRTQTKSQTEAFPIICTETCVKLARQLCRKLVREHEGTIAGKQHHTNLHAAQRSHHMLPHTNEVKTQAFQTIPTKPPWLPDLTGQTELCFRLGGC
jgi:hypothetical protein